MPIVEATFVAADVHDGHGRRDKTLALRLEAAMSAAVQTCHEQGVTNPTEIKEAMMAAYRSERAK